MRRIRTQQGFTLIELMLTAAIIGLMAVVTVPYLVGQPGSQQLERATQQLAWDIIAARMEAVTQNRKVKLFVTPTIYKICYDANNDDTVDDCEGNAKIKNVSSNYGVTLASSAEPVFAPRGVVAPAATITLSNASGSKNVVVNITGRIRIDG